MVIDALDDERLDEAVSQMAQTVRARSPAAVRLGKRMFYRQRELELSAAYAPASSAMAANMMEEDAREGISAFLEKHQPVWTSSSQ